MELVIVACAVYALAMGTVRVVTKMGCTLTYVSRSCRSSQTRVNVDIYVTRTKGDLVDTPMWYELAFGFVVPVIWCHNNFVDICLSCSVFIMIWIVCIFG